MKTTLFALILILTAAPAQAGALETSFHPAIPDNLEFADSPEKIIEKMGRQPDGRNGEAAAGVYIYNLGKTDHLPPLQLEYRFEDGRLQDLTLTCEPIPINHDDLENSTAPVYQVYKYLGSGLIN